ncbi:SRPBCC family protein [Herbaspirillum sp. RTI4]|uniref:aromatic ring-hydroxylating oxygenase subunit alpha n=1 Tax=Herbaspirillum sp. RTI4 TaxID=3048640 RepID=UPI002AB52D1F|nr:SRPBCC family protein [Herbaspirillum sp. RTI4]MDY7577042.1 SRPBCC family protein [Herbaspirillum sp. RTI4]MEA9982222.1 SRPBCC family protein [Herbaspirillum sp. RTI4]
MSIPINNYIDPAIFDEELEKVFSRQMFIAHQNDIPAADDYYSFRAGKRSYTLRNIGAQNRLLDNVCRHRFNLIDPPGFGNRKFRCGYHGWTYDADGGASFIPLRNTFKNLPDDIRLTSAPHEDIHGFQFLMQADPARRQTVARLLTQMGTPAGGHFFRGEIRHQCNWKLIVENVLDSYHVSFVHASTFSKAGYSSTGRVEPVPLNSEYDTAVTHYPDEASAKQMLRIVRNITPAYRHLHIFPNLFLSIGSELVYYVANVMPVSTNESVLHYRLYPTEKMLALTPGLRDSFMQSAIDLTAQTLEEDRLMLESNQIGLLSAQGAYTLCENELRIRHFHDAYRRFL